MRIYDKPAKIDLVYFSGTGGTKRAALQLADSIRSQGIQVSIHELTHMNTFIIEETDMLVVIYPVYALNAPKPIDSFLTRLPKVVGRPAVVISVSGGGEISPNTACRLHCIKRLEQRGYRVVYERMLVMPSNIFISTPDELSVRLLQVLPARLNKIAADISIGVYHRTKPNLLDRFLSHIGELEKVKLSSWIFGKHFRVKNECTGCGLCMEGCPMGNIDMINNHPVFKCSCILCLKCIYSCPRNALVPGIGKFMIIKEGYRIDRWEDRMCQDGTSEMNKKYGYAYSGIIKYLSENDVDL